MQTLMFNPQIFEFFHLMPYPPLASATPAGTVTSQPSICSVTITWQPRRDLHSIHNVPLAMNITSSGAASI